MLLIYLINAYKPDLYGNVKYVLLLFTNLIMFLSVYKPEIE